MICGCAPKQVRESDRLLIDGLEASLALMPAIPGSEAAIGLVDRSINTAIAGLGTAGCDQRCSRKVRRYRHWRQITDLAGAAKEKAAAAYRGVDRLRTAAAALPSAIWQLEPQWVVSPCS